MSASGFAAVAIGVPVLGFVLAATLYGATATPALALAGYGALVSTGAMFLNLLKELRDQADLSGYLWTVDPGAGPITTIRLVNRGRRKVRVESIGFSSSRFDRGTPYGKWYGAAPESLLPIELEEVDAVQRWCKPSEVAWFYRHKPPLKWALVEDSTGGVHRLRLDDQTRFAVAQPEGRDRSGAGGPGVHKGR